MNSIDETGRLPDTLNWTLCIRQDYSAYYSNLALHLIQRELRGGQLPEREFNVVISSNFTVLLSIFSRALVKPDKKIWQSKGLRIQPCFTP